MGDKNIRDGVKVSIATWRNLVAGSPPVAQGSAFFFLHSFCYSPCVLFWSNNLAYFSGSHKVVIYM